MKTTVRLDDGRWQHTFRQSDLNNFRMCPERARLQWTDQYKEITTDSAVIGTALHLGIEAILQHHKQGLPIEPGEIEQVVMDLLDHEWNNLVRMEVSYKEAIDLSLDCLYRWINGPWSEVIRDSTDPKQWQIEERFDLEVASDDERVIRIQGTYDFFDGDRVWDWKTGRVPYSKWTVHRYSVQPTFYTLGAGVRDFRFCYIPREGDSTENIDVVRTKGEQAFLIKELTNVGKLVEADLSHWPLGSTDWWCSERWCSEFAQGRCRGETTKIYSEESWV